MATQTAHFELEKPALTDVADIAVLNNNFDDIDTVMFANQERSVAAVSNQADAYDAAQTYAVGDLVIYENRLYKCTTAVTVAEPWDSTKWEPTTLAESGGTGVEANPTGTPTDTLETIDINGTVYEVGGNEPVSKTVTGNPISITDAADAPIVSGEVTFEPVQDLHGYDKPWAGGNGKNKYKVDTQTSTANGITYTVNSDGTITVSGTATAVSQKILGNTTLSAGTYILNGCPSGGSATTYDLRVDNETIETGDGVEFTLSAETSVSVVITVRNGQTVNGVVFKPMIRLATETDPTFEPYSNICPIEGYDDCEVEVTGKNLLQNKAVMPFILRGVTFTQNSDGSITANGTATNGDVILPLWARNTNNVHLPSGQYTYKACPSGGSVNTFYCQLQATRDGSLYEFGSDYGEGVTANVLSTDVMQATIRIVSGVTVNNVTFYPQLEKGSTATAYEPYQSTTYTIDLDGTRYGGKVNLVSGVMEVNMAIVDLGSLSYTYQTTYGRFVCVISGIKQASVRTLPLICSCYQTIDDGRPISQVPDSSIYNDQNDENIYIHDSRYTSASDLKTALTGQTLCYPLATPFTVQLTPEQIRTLEGTNNISTNMTDMSLEYITQEYQPLVKLIEQSAGHHYSTQERVVGTWIDGKPLYEKSYNVTTPDAVDTVHQIIEVPTNSVIVNIFGMYNNQFPIHFYFDVDNRIETWLNNAKTHVVNKTPYNLLLNLSGTVTIQYTKTTD